MWVKSDEVNHRMIRSRWLGATCGGHGIFEFKVIDRYQVQGMTWHTL